MKIARILIVVIMYLSGSLLSASGLKKVLVLDFKNILGSTEYAYLEGSITEAVNNSLKAKFAFQETRRDDWEQVAKENYIVKDDLYTYTAAMNLGLYARQDVVIFGGFIAEIPKGKSIPQMTTRVRILDIGKKKEIADFKMSNPIDGTIFDSVEKIAARIVKEAGAVLPSKEDAAAGRFKKEIPSFSQLSLRGMYAPVAIGAHQTVEPAASFAGTDFNNQSGVLFDYHYFGLFTEELGFYAGGGVKAASDTFEYALNSTGVPTALQSFAGFAGLAWRQKISTSFYLQPFIGGGLQYDSMRFNYKSSTIEILSPDGDPITQQEYSLLSPFAAAGLRGGYQITKWLALELGVQYSAYFYSGDMGQNASVDLGLGFKL